jgi:hypothetical protein
VWVFRQNLNNRTAKKSVNGISPQFQLSLLERPEIEAAIATVAEAEAEFRGAVFTRREVVDFILDLAGYTSSKPLYDARILEPSMGGGDFLFPVIDRLFETYKRKYSDRDDPVDLLGNCIVGVEVHRATFEKVHTLVVKKLRGKGLNAKQARALCKRWLRRGDFLLLPLDRNFTHVAGNPPYIRQELIPDVLMAE